MATCTDYVTQSKLILTMFRNNGPHNARRWDSQITNVYDQIEAIEINGTFKNAGANIFKFQHFVKLVESGEAKFSIFQLLVFGGSNFNLSRWDISWPEVNIASLANKIHSKYDFTDNTMAFFFAGSLSSNSVFPNSNYAYQTGFLAVLQEGFTYNCQYSMTETFIINDNPQITSRIDPNPISHVAYTVKSPALFETYTQINHNSFFQKRNFDPFMTQPCSPVSLDNGTE